MKSCDLTTGAGRLKKSFAQLKERWTQAKTHWKDDAARQFEEEYLQPLPAQFQLAMAAIHRLTEVLQKAERECADPDRTE